MKNKKNNIIPFDACGFRSPYKAMENRDEKVPVYSEEPNIDGTYDIIGWVKESDLW